MKKLRGKPNKNKLSNLFNKVAGAVTKAVGTPVAFIIALLIIISWAVMGPVFGYSDTWQLVINTGTTIITFLMVFIIQQSQNKETTAIQLKLNELIACNEKASNRLVDIEDLTEEELAMIKKFYIKLSRLAEKETDLFHSHSLDEATDNQAGKVKGAKKTTTKNE